MYISYLLFIATVASAAFGQSEDAKLRIGLIGLDTSHVNVFLRIYNDTKSKDHIPGGIIVAAFKGGSPDMPASSRRIDGFTKNAVERYGVKLVDSIEQLAREVDAIMILSVDGRPHLDQFRRTLGERKPVFIDKPCGGTLHDVIEIARLSRETQTPCFSASGMRFSQDRTQLSHDRIGEITAAYSFGATEAAPHHPDLFFYGVHGVEALYTVMGTGCEQVVRTHLPRMEVVTGVWKEGRTGTFHGNRQGNRDYGVRVIGTKGTATVGEIVGPYQPLARAIMTFFQTRRSPVDMEATIEIFAFMEAADESKRRGGVPVKLADVITAASR